MKSKLVALVILITTISLGAITFDVTFGGTERDGANSIEQTTDGGYIVAGFTQSFGAGSSNCWLIKTDENGTQEWEQIYGGNGYDGASCVQQTSDDGYIIAGYTDSFGAGGYDFYLIKTSIDGTVEWESTFGGSEWEVARSVMQTTDGGFIIAGETTSYGAGMADFWLVKVDANGVMQWDSIFGGSAYDDAYSVQQTTDGGYIVVGRANGYGPAEGNVLLIKTDENGTLEWEQNFGDTGFDEAFSVQETIDGGFILVGHTYSSETGSDSWLIKTDINGFIEWEQIIETNDPDGFLEVRQTIDEGYIMVGYTGVDGVSNTDFRLVKTDANGFVEWERTFGGTDWEIGRFVRETDDGFILAGETASFGAGNYDFWLIKTNEIGSINIEINPNEFILEMMNNEIFSDEFTISNIGSETLDYSIETNFLNGEDWLSTNPNSGELLEGETDIIEITFDTADLTAGIYLSEIVVTFNGEDVIIPVTLTVLGTDVEEDTVSNASILFGNYPNPFNPTTTISFNLSNQDAKDAKLEIYNLKGQKIKIFPVILSGDEGRGGRQYNIVWNGTDDNNQPVSSGVYFYKLKAGEFFQTKKMILMK